MEWVILTLLVVIGPLILAMVGAVYWSDWSNKRAAIRHVRESAAAEATQDVPALWNRLDTKLAVSRNTHGALVLEEDWFVPFAHDLIRRLEENVGASGRRCAGVAWIHNTRREQPEAGVVVLVGSGLAVETRSMYFNFHGGPGVVDLTDDPEVAFGETDPMPDIGVPRGIPTFSFQTPWDDYHLLVVGDVPGYVGFWDGMSGLVDQMRDQIAAQADVAGPLPEVRLIRSAEEAEQVAAEWLRWMGFGDAAATPSGADEGIDVASSEMVAQVKARMTSTTRPEVQQHYGVAVAEGKQAVFFSMTDYTTEAVGWADRVGVALSQFDRGGQPEPVNRAAMELFQNGEHEEESGSGD